MSQDNLQFKIFQLVSECGADLISTHDQKGFYLFVSTNCRHLLGWRREIFLGKDVYEFCHPEDVGVLRAHHDTPGESTVEYRVRNSSGEYKWVETRSRTYVSEGRAERICFTRDITERIKLREANKKLNAMARTDALTQIDNYLSFKDRLDNLILEAERGRKFSLVMTDIDHFKKFNDTHGHLAGDLVLQEVAGALKAGIRRVDFVGRYGGEEFVLLLPDTEMEGAKILTGRLRERILALSLPYGPVTASFGLCSYDHRKTRDELIRCADRVLYRAKDLGRNRIESCDNSPACFG